MFRLNLKEELARGRRVIDLKSLFSESYAAESYQKSIQKQMAERLEKEKIIQVKPEVVGRLAGKYDIGAGSLAYYTIAISHHNSKLFVEMSFLEKTELLPVSETDYIMIGLEETVKFKFILDENGKAIQLAMTMYGEESLATKKL